MVRMHYIQFTWQSLFSLRWGNNGASNKQHVKFSERQYLVVIQGGSKQFELVKGFM
jgi:hypothetical protein